jgi:hypothetical protein
MRSSIICFFIFLLVCFKTEAYAQNNSKQDTSTHSTSKVIEKHPSVAVKFSHTNHFSYFNNAIDIIPSNLYLKTIGFFCIKELEIEKALRMPLRFRLGSVAYTDRMESKNELRPAAK